MHPPLDRPHPECQLEIKALLDCHTEHPYMKFLGKCNDQKAKLDACFKLEKEHKRKANFNKAIEERKAFEKLKEQNKSNVN